MVPRTEPGKVRVLIVDDSALMRKILADILRSDSEIEIVGIARDGEEAIRQAKSLHPDVITLDVEMPGRTGLDILPDLLSASNDASVIMISSHTKEGAATTLAALERGAIDFMPKPDKHQFTQLRDSRDLLVGKVHAAAKARPRRRKLEPPPTTAEPATHTELPSREEPPVENRITVPSASSRCVVIGISTGGPQALSAVLPLINAPVPPILIVQHMPAGFTSVFAERLNRACSLEVKEAEEGDLVSPGRILVAPGGRHMAVKGLPPNTHVTLSDTPPVNGHRPSIDVLFISVARLFQAGTVGFIMTGMGRDGVEGCKRIQTVGGVTLGQDEATSAVYGMNKAAMLEGAVSAQFPLSRLPALIKKFSRDK